MKMKYLTPLFALLLCQALSAQVKIGDNPQTIDPASLLELESTQQVLVITRVTTPQMEAISPTNGALVYNTDETCLFYHNGQRWINLCEALGLSFTNEPIVNRDSTIIITEFEDRINFEVGRIRGGDDTGEFNNIIDFSITSQDIQNNSININKLADASVGTAELFDNAVTAAKLNPDVAGTGITQNAAGALEVDVSNITGNGNIISEDLTVGGSVDPLFGDVTLEIAPEAVGNEEVAGDAVTSDKIADQAITADDIQDDAVTAAKINADVVGDGLVQNADGALEVNVADFTGDGELSSPSGTITLTGVTESALFEDVEVDVDIPQLISGDAENAITTGTTGGLFATDDQEASEVSFDDSTAQLGSNQVQGALEALAASNGADLDTDPTNEFSLTGTGPPAAPGTSEGQTYVDINAGQLFVWDGAAWISVGGTNAVDNDPDPQNELQDLDFTEGVISLSSDPTPTNIDLSNYDTNAADDFDGEWLSLLNRPAGLDDGDDNTTYTAGTGLLLTGTEFSVDNSSIAAAWTNLVNIPPNLDTDSTDDFDGEWLSLSNRPTGLDDGDDNTTYTAGAGLLLTGTEFSVDNSSIAADWTNLVNIPPNLDADSTDDFDGEWISLANRPVGLDDGDTDFGNTNLTIESNRFHALNGNDIVFTGSGSIGIGNNANPPQSRLDVDGQIQARNGFAAAGGSAGQPHYGFYTNDDTNMGMYRIGIDQLGFSTSGTEAVRISAAGDVGIGNIVPLAKLHVNGDAQIDGNLLVTTINGSTFPDYVFRSYFTGLSNLKSNYQMLSLEEVSTFIEMHHHLPGVTSAKEVEEQGGIILNKSITQNLEKIEELFLYTIEQEDEIKSLKKENADLSLELESLKERMSYIESLLNQKKQK